MNEDTRVERLVATVENVCASLTEVTGELRATNESVQKMTLNVALMEQKVDTHAREIYAGDNSSRIRTLELHVKGLYALVGFLVISIGGQLLGLLSQHWHYGSPGGK